MIVAEGHIAVLLQLFWINHPFVRLDGWVRHVYETKDELLEEEEHQSPDCECHKTTQ